MVYLLDANDYDEKELLLLNKRILQNTMKDCLGDLERWPLKMEIERIDNKLKEMEIVNGS